MNLGSPVTETLEKSRCMLIEELQRCERLGIPHFNFHPGKWKPLLFFVHYKSYLVSQDDWVTGQDYFLFLKCIIHMSFFLSTHFFMVKYQDIFHFSWNNLMTWMLMPEKYKCLIVLIIPFLTLTGSTVGKIKREECCKIIAESINLAHRQTKGVICVLENMSCQVICTFIFFSSIHFASQTNLNLLH